MKQTERFDAIFLGRKLGTCSGWDQVMEQTDVYDFVPIPELIGYHPGTLTINSETGQAQIESGSTLTICDLDICRTLSNLPMLEA